jgi:hypothetical protein
LNSSSQFCTITLLCAGFRLGSRYFKSDVDYEPGKPFLGGGEEVETADCVYGAVRALDAATGKALWDFQTGGTCTANPIAFRLDGHERIATACGQALFVIGLP